MPISSRHKQRPGEWRDVLAPEVLEQYVGMHIAIIHKKVVAAGATYEDVRVQAEALYPSEMPYLAYIADTTYEDQRDAEAQPSSTAADTAPEPAPVEAAA